MLGVLNVESYPMTAGNPGVWINCAGKSTVSLIVSDNSAANQAVVYFGSSQLDVDDAAAGALSQGARVGVLKSGISGEATILTLPTPNARVYFLAIAQNPIVTVVNV